MKANAEALFKGNSSVGKSSILLRFSDETWLSEDESSATIGVDFRVRAVHELIQDCAKTNFMRSGYQDGRTREESQTQHLGSFFHTQATGVACPLTLIIGYSWSRAVPNYYFVLLPRCPGHYPR